MSRMPWAVICTVVAMASSGCIANIFIDTTTTTREFACAVIAPDSEDALILDVRVDERTHLSPIQAVGALQDAIAGIAGRDVNSIEVRITALEDAPTRWTSDDWAVEMDAFSPRAGLRSMHMAIYWVLDMEGSDTGALLAPGAIAISQVALDAKASATGAPLDAVATAVLLHHAGHALGGVNKGIPMQANHEGQPGHDANGTSVMHHSWHDAGNSFWGHNATYDGYASEQLLDWRMAVNNPLVCP